MGGGLVRRCLPPFPLRWLRAKASWPPLPFSAYPVERVNLPAGRWHRYALSSPSATWPSCVRKAPARSWRSSVFDSCPTWARRFDDRLTSSPTRYFSASSCAVAGSVLPNANAANCDRPANRWTDAIRSPSNDVASLTAISRFSAICDSRLSALVRRLGQPNRRDSTELIQARIGSILP